MCNPVHITSGDRAGGSLERAGLPGQVLVWHDILYDGPRRPGWPDQEALDARAFFIEEATAGGLDRHRVLKTLHNQYRKLADAAANEHVVLWFDACLFDQSMLAHILTCLRDQNARKVELLCVDHFTGIEPFHGLGQLKSDQLACLYGNRQPVTEAQFDFAFRVDGAFAMQDFGVLTELSQMRDAPLPWVPAAAARWLQERPNSTTGLGRLETLALSAIRAGHATPAKIFASVAAADTPPQFWGDATLWAKINALAQRQPPLVRIDGPHDRLPEWASDVPLNDFRVTALPSNTSHPSAANRGSG
jgi:hypothetical protein